VPQITADSPGGIPAFTAPAAPGYSIPEDNSSERRLTLFIFLFGCCYLWLFRRYTTMDPDEGIILQGAQRILDGQVLYRDFFSFLTPGSFYQTALLLRIFGDSIIVARTALVIIGASISSITYLLARRVCSRTVSVSTAVVSIIATLPYRFVVLHNWDSTFWAVIGTYAGLRWIESKRSRWALLAGLTISLTCLCEQSKGVGMLLGVFLTFAALLAARQTTRKIANPAGIAFAIGFLGPIVGTILFFAAHRALGPMLDDLLWPFRYYSTANHVPYGYQNWSDTTRVLLFGSGTFLERFIALWAVSPCFLIPVLPLISMGLLVLSLARLASTKYDRAAASYYVYVNAVIVGLLISIYFVRPDIVHFMYVFPLLALVIAWFIQGTDISLRSFDPIKPLALGVLAVAFFLFSVSVLWRVLRPPVRLETRRGTITLERQDEVLATVEAQTRPGDKIFVYPYAPIYYFLSGTASPTNIDYFQPGMNTAVQAAEIVASLNSDPNLTSYFEFGFVQKIPTSWPGTPLSDIATDSVGDFLLRSSSPCRILHSATQTRFLMLARPGHACAKLDTH
jgi:4-amino-4-deoxy-L-arabinose transferase-like glycosyltransferase